MEDNADRVEFQNQRLLAVSEADVTWLLCSSLAALVLLTGYRLLWRARYGPRRGEGPPLCGRVVGPGAPGTVVCRASSTGEVIGSESFELQEASGQRRLVTTTGFNLCLRARAVAVGDRVTVHALPTTVLRAEAGYRQSALQHAVAALRIRRGAWPELRALDLGLVAAALLFAGSGGVALASHLRAARADLDCPPRATARGARPPAGDEQWCELSLPAGLVQLHGPFVRWAGPGRLAESGQYVYGEREGTWTRWWPDGKLAERGQYVDGKKRGPWSYWDEAGRPGSGYRRDFQYPGSR